MQVYSTQLQYPTFSKGDLDTVSRHGSRAQEDLLSSPGANRRSSYLWRCGFIMCGQGNACALGLPLPGSILVSYK